MNVDNLKVEKKKRGGKRREKREPKREEKTKRIESKGEMIRSGFSKTLVSISRIYSIPATPLFLK